MKLLMNKCLMQTADSKKMEYQRENNQFFMNLISLNTTRYICLVVFLGVLFASCTKSVKLQELILKDDLFYEKSKTTVFSGKIHDTYASGKDSLIAQIDSGLYNGNYRVFYDTGIMKDSIVYNKGVVVAFKTFKSNGKPVVISGSKRLFVNDGDIEKVYVKLNGEKKEILFSGLCIDSFQYETSDIKRRKVLTYEYSYYKGEQLGCEICRKSDGNLFTGSALIYTSENELSEKANFDNGLKNGKCLSYYKGQLIDEYIYKNGKKEGENLHYYDGSLFGKCKYVNDKREGIYYGYSSEGKITEKGYYSNGKKEGHVTLYWSNASGLRGEENYVNGKKQGTNWYYTPDRTKYVENYVDGKENGWLYVYRSSGDLMAKVKFINGKGIALYDSDGSLIKKY